MSALDVVIEPSTMKTIVVHLAGELDAISVEQLSECVDTIEPGFTTVILDLQQLAFLDSVGIGCLVRLHQSLDENARMLQLRNLTGHPLRTIEVADLNRYLYVI
jgi:anti-anti-sigma factor